MRYRRIAIAAAAAASLLGAAAIAQTAMTAAQTRATTSTAGTYTMDVNHTSIIARVTHSGGTSYSTFRFGKSTGTLNIDPKAPQNAQLSVTVDPSSIMTPVTGNFPTELLGERFLNVPKFPTATFKSTSVRVNGGAAQVTGDLTFMGVTKPAVIDAELVGGGPSARGGDVLGFTGTMKFKRSDFGFTSMQGAVGDDVTLVLDVEFGKS